MLKNTILAFVGSIFLVACGGGGSGGEGNTGGNPGGNPGGGGDSDTPENYTVSTQYNSEQGDVSPDSAVVVEGDTETFDISPAEGYVLGNVSGCGGELVGESTYTTGAITSNCTVTINFNEAPDEGIFVETQTSTGDIEVYENGLGDIVVDADEMSSGVLTFNTNLTNYGISDSSNEYVTFSIDSNIVEFQTFDVNSLTTVSFTVTATEGGTEKVKNVVFNINPTNEIAIDGAFCFEGYCNGEEPKDVTHNLFSEEVFEAHYIAVAPAETVLEYKVSPDFGVVSDIVVTKDVRGSAISYEYKMEDSEIVINNPYNYNDSPLVKYTVTMTNEDGQQSTETINIMYFNAYASGRFTNFNDSPVALPMSGSETFKVEFENYGSSDSKELYIRDFDMMIPSVVATIDENDSCNTDENGNARLSTCDLISMSVNQETDEVTITTNLTDLISNNRDTFSNGLQLYPYIVVCVTPSADNFNAEDCQDLYIAGMGGFISEYNDQEQAKIDELQALMPKVRAYFEYDVAIKELANILNAKGYISNQRREEYINEIRFLSSPLTQEYNIAMQYIFNINGNSVSGLQNQENSIATTISNIEYYLEYDDFAEQKAEIYNEIINEAQVSSDYGYLDNISPIVTGDDGQPTRFAYNESYGEMIDGEFVFSPKYKILNLAVNKAKK